MSAAHKKMRICAGLVALWSAIAAAHTAHAQDNYPAKTIRLIVPSSPGGGTDASARIVSPKLSERLGQSVVIEYRPGAAAMIGTEAGARAAPDAFPATKPCSGSASSAPPRRRATA